MHMYKCGNPQWESDWRQQKVRGAFGGWLCGCRGLGSSGSGV